tara:strand:- start:712 stop:927 length:216 start_codon:yes stop_codon:yes gene_type:complete
MPYVCKKCSSEEVEVKGWINPNTGRDKSEGIYDNEFSYCKDCEEAELGITWKDDPIKRNVDVWFSTTEDNQ